LHGFRKWDLRPVLYGAIQVPPDVVRRQSVKVTRQLRLRRAHGLITKLAHTHRYQLTVRGRTILSGLLAARQASAAKLTEIAA